MAHSDYWALTDHHHKVSPFPCDNIPIPPNFILPLHLRHNHVSAPAPPNADVAAHADCNISWASHVVPVIDLAHYDDSTSFQLHRACAEWGLFHTINHGVPHAVLQQMQTQIDDFLTLPVAERCPRSLGNLGQGYGTGFVRLSTGVTEWRDCLRLSTFPLSDRDYEAWPLSPLFRKAIEEFSDEMRALQLRLMGCLSQNLGLGVSRLREIVGDMHQTVLMNHYPPCPQPDLVAGIDQHTDIGAITCVIQQNDVVGLQVFHDGVWIPVPPVPGAIIVLVGDQIEIASNGTYKSALHRAVLNATKRRVSVTSFYQLRAEQVVAPAAELIDDDEHPPLYKPTRFADHEAAKKGSSPSTKL